MKCAMNLIKMGEKLKTTRKQGPCQQVEIQDKFYGEPQMLQLRLQQ